MLRQMKTGFKSASQAQGSALVIALFLCMLISIGLASYLTLVEAQSRIVVRSQGWNNALTMAEAGAEEALAQLNPGVNTTANVDRTANGWGAPSGGIYGPKTRSLSNDVYVVSYTTDLYPTIYSTGRVTLPSLAAPITRVIEIRTTNVPL